MFKGTSLYKTQPTNNWKFQEVALVFNPKNENSNR
jgi:hypothetical protein